MYTYFISQYHCICINDDFTWFYNYILCFTLLCVCVYRCADERADVWNQINHTNTNYYIVFLHFVSLYCAYGHACAEACGHTMPQWVHLNTTACVPTIDALRHVQRCPWNPRASLLRSTTENSDTSSPHRFTLTSRRRIKAGPWHLTTSSWFRRSSWNACVMLSWHSASCETTLAEFWTSSVALPRIDGLMWFEFGFAWSSQRCQKGSKRDILKKIFRSEWWAVAAVL